jgi:hypothetical protein
MFQPLEAISADSDALREKRPELPGHADSSLHHVVVVILKHALDYVVFKVADRPNLEVVMYLPLPESDTALKLQQLLVM